MFLSTPIYLFLSELFFISESVKIWTYICKKYEALLHNSVNFYFLISYYILKNCNHHGLIGLDYLGVMSKTKRLESLKCENKSTLIKRISKNAKSCRKSSNYPYNKH